MITRTSTPRRATLAAAFAALFVGSLLTGCGETTGGIPCSSGWVTYGNTPYCYCADTDRLIDCNDAIVHVFDPETRVQYDLERLWRDAPRLDLGIPGVEAEPPPLAADEEDARKLDRLAGE